MLADLFEQFVKERKYLKNVTPKTVTYYHNSWDSFVKATFIAIGFAISVQLRRFVN